jgi:hypothetical protein
MPFDEVYLHRLAEELREKGVQLEAGLSDEEINRTEKEYAINFPPDLRMLLEVVLFRRAFQTGAQVWSHGRSLSGRTGRLS